MVVVVLFQPFPGHSCGSKSDCLSDKATGFEKNPNLPDTFSLHDHDHTLPSLSYPLLNICPLYWVCSSNS